MRSGTYRGGCSCDVAVQQRGGTVAITEDKEERKNVYVIFKIQNSQFFLLWVETQNGVVFAAVIEQSESRSQQGLITSCLSAEQGQDCRKRPSPQMRIFKLKTEVLVTGMT